MKIFLYLKRMFLVAFKSPKYKAGSFISLFWILAIPRLHGLHTGHPPIALLPFPSLFPYPASPPLPPFSARRLSAYASSLPTFRPQLRYHQNLKSTFQWNSIIRARLDAGHFDPALSIFSYMLATGSRPDHFTLPLVARAAWPLPGRANVGQAIHSVGIHLGFCSNIYFCNSLIDYFVRCEDTVIAQHIFDEMLQRDVVSWTTMISGYLHTEDFSESSRMFHEMRLCDIEPNSVTLSIILRAFEREKDANGGRQIHGFAIKTGIFCHELVQNSTLTLYSKLGSFIEAEKLFDSMKETTPTSWNILMMGYTSAGYLTKVVECFQCMMAALCLPSPETLTLVLSALTKLKSLRMGQQIHSYAVKSGQIDTILQASFLNIYAKCADLESAFSFLHEVNAINSSNLWIIMMWAFIQSGQFREAIRLFLRMQSEGFEPNVDSLMCLVCAYAHIGALLPGKAIHGYMIKHQLRAESQAEKLETSILHMYAKCGNIILAQRCFDRMEYRDTVAWSSMIEGYAINGMGSEAMKMLQGMKEAGIRPNSVTFLSLLSSCSHSGLVDEGWKVISSMSEEFGIKPELNHITCLVDLLARKGKIYEALSLIRSMGVKPDARIWGALLSSCWVHQNVCIGDYAAQCLFQLEPDNRGYHIVSSKVNAGGNRWTKAESIWKFLDEVDFRARPGASFIEEKGGFFTPVTLDHSYQRGGSLN